MYNLFLDDERLPADDGREWIIARSFAQAIEIMEKNGCPNYMTFDHDLGEEKTGKDVVKWMINKDLDEGGKWMLRGFSYDIHSQNVPGAKNIDSELSSYFFYKML